MIDSKTSIYLDANASVPACSAAKDALIHALDVVGNPSSPHALGRHARKILDDARDAVARALSVSSKEVFFNSGASEGNRYLVEAAIRSGKSVWASALEHPSLAKPLSRARNVEIHEADVVFHTAAHNETGSIIDLENIIARAKPDAIIAVDAAQYMGRRQGLPDRVDAIVVSAHKMGGYAGVGALVLKKRAQSLENPFLGGGQEGGRRPGTEATALIAAFQAAASVIDVTRMQHQALAPLRDALEQAIVKAWGARVIGTGERLENTTAVFVPGVDGAALRIAIDQARVCVGFGSACSALAPEPSKGLMSFGLSAKEAQQTVRFSLAPQTTREQVETAIDRLKDIIAPLRESQKHS